MSDEEYSVGFLGGQYLGSEPVPRNTDLIDPPYNPKTATAHLAAQMALQRLREVGWCT